MAIVFRRRKGSYDTWHFCINCSKWPTQDYEERYTEPSEGEKCNECKSKKARGECTLKSS